MFQRISSLILLFCLTAALLPHGNAAAANQKPEHFANSDVEAYIEEYLYGMDEEQGNRPRLTTEKCTLRNFGTKLIENGTRFYP